MVIVLDCITLYSVPVFYDHPHILKICASSSHAHVVVAHYEEVLFDSCRSLCTYQFPLPADTKQNEADSRQL